MTAVETAGNKRQPADGPWLRAMRRSSALRAAQQHDAMVRSPVRKFSVGQEPASGSPDWAHRCRTRAARLAPVGNRQLALHAVGMPRPRTPDGWPMPFTGKDAADPCATEVRLEVLCSQSRWCQVCGLPVSPGTGYAMRRPQHQYVSDSGMAVPWVEGRSLLHLACLRFSMRYCPEIIRQLWQGVAHVVKEPDECDYTVMDGVMLDTHEYADFIVPVWELETARDTGGDTETVRRLLDQAADLNARATTVLFPRLAPDGGNHVPRSS